MSSSQPDVKLLAQEEIPQGAFPGRGGGDLRVFFAPSAHDQAWQHATSNKSVEICGVLVGVWRRDAEGPYVEVQHIIQCDTAKSGHAEVTFTHEAWGKINQEMDTKYADSRIVGWYHSHPDFGIFLSDPDVFIHQHFFSGAGQIALVIDPIRRLEGVFCWRAGKPTLMTHYWAGSKLLIRPADPAPAAQSGVSGTAMNSADLSAGRGRADDRGDWTSTLTTTGLIFLAGMLGYMLAGWADARKEQLVREAIAMQFFQAKILRPGLEEHVEQARITMSQLKDRMAQIEQASNPKAESKENDSKSDLKATWKGAKEEVSRMGEILGSIERNYALSPQEQAAIMRMVLAGQNSSGRDPRREGKSGGAEDSAPPKKSSKGMLELTPDKKPKESKSSDGKSSDGKSTEGKPAVKSKESPAGEKPADKSSAKSTNK